MVNIYLYIHGMQNLHTKQGQLGHVMQYFLGVLVHI
jgi:hypothetical protein